MKKAVFIGGGASSLCSAVLLKQLEPSFDVVVVEKDKKLGRKLAMTGGGKCNIAPLKDNAYVYNVPSISRLEKLYQDIPLKQYLSLLGQIGIEAKTIKDYGYYPIHESAPQVVKNLYHQINVLGIKVINDEFIGYSNEKDKVIVKLEQENIIADYLIIATGGLSPRMMGVFKEHNIKTSNIYPGLCPIKVKENVSNLFGTRFEAVITLLYKKNIVKQYYGEVQFKKDGLSGIPVLNLSSLIARKMIEEENNLNDYQISIGLPKELIPNILGHTIEEALFMLYREDYVNYLIEKHNLNRKEIVNSSNEKSILGIIKDERFTVSSLYDFKDSQVTIGGVFLDEIDENFALKTSPNVFVVGETLNVDGICGG